MSKTPAPVIATIFPDVLHIGPHRLRPLTMAHYILLEKIDSPLLRASEAGDQNAARSTSTDVGRALFVAKLTDRELRVYCEGFDREAFDTEAWNFISTIPISDLATIEPTLSALFKGATSTMIGGDGLPDTPDTAEKKTK